MRRRTRTRSVENCRLTHPTGGWSGMPMTSLSIFHTLMTRQRKAAKGAKWAKGDGDGPDGRRDEDEERLKCNPVTASPKGCRPDEGEGNPTRSENRKIWGHAKCCQLHCTIFAHIESGNFDNLRNFKNVLMNCNILNNEFCEPCAISPPYFFLFFVFFKERLTDWDRPGRLGWKRCRDKGNPSELFTLLSKDISVRSEGELKLKLKVRVPQVVGYPD